MMDEGVTPVSTRIQTASTPHTDSGAPPSMRDKTWKLRRQGACEMCRMKKIRCE